MNARYRIAMVSPGPFPCARGSQVLVRELAEALAARGHSVHVIAYAPGDGRIDAEGIQVHRTPAILGGVDSFGPKPWRIVLNLFLLATLYRVVRQHGVHVIHAHNYESPVLGYVIRFLFGIPVVYHAHNLMGDELEHYFVARWARLAARRLGGLLDRMIPRRADWVLALSDAMATDLLQHGVPPTRLEVIPPGVFWGGTADDREPDDPFPGAKVILYSGNLDPYQDIPTLIRCMADLRREVPEAVLVILTHAADKLAELRVRLGTCEGVHFSVAPGFDQVRPLLRRADVLVCPRMSWSGFPIKLLNYMAAGRPIVVSARVGQALGQGPWIAAPTSDPAALAEAIGFALRHPGKGVRLAGEARRRVREAHDWSRLVPRIEGVYRRLTEPGRGASQNCGTA